MIATAIRSRSVSGASARYLAQASARKRRASSREGVNMRALGGLAAEFAQVVDDALAALRRARDADVAAVQDQPVMRVLPEFLRHELQQLALDLVDVLARC